MAHNHYESVFILTPVLDTQGVEKAVNECINIIQKEGGNIVHQENWGIQELAYPINKQKRGFYVVLEFESAPEVVKKITTYFRRSEQIIRHIVCKLDRHGIEYLAEKRKNKEAAILKEKETAAAALQEEKQ